jgi:plastocyanin
MRLPVSLALALVLSITPSFAANVTVTIRNMAFSPASVSVGTGDSVVFVNRDTVPHTATARNGAFNTGEIEPGRRVSVKIAKTGSLAYFCQIHPSMRGTIKAK